MGGGLWESILRAVQARAEVEQGLGQTGRRREGKSCLNKGPRAWRWDSHDSHPEAEEVMQSEMTKTLPGRLRTRAVSQGHQEVVQVFWLCLQWCFTCREACVLSTYCMPGMVISSLHTLSNFM